MKKVIALLTLICGSLLVNTPAFAQDKADKAAEAPAATAAPAAPAEPEAKPAEAKPAPTPNKGDVAWMLTSTALVLLMVPGLAMFYGGLVRTKNVLGTMMHSFAAMAVVGVLWVVAGFAIAFGPNALGGLIGWDPGLVLLRAIDGTVGANGVPDLVFAMFQGKFAIITPALLAGAIRQSALAWPRKRPGAGARRRWAKAGRVFWGHVFPLPAT